MVEPILAIAAAIAMGLGALGAGYSQASVGAAATGIVAENPKEFPKALILTALPEFIAILGFVVAIIILIL